jgi:hypothetical protein
MLATDGKPLRIFPEQEPMAARQTERAFFLCAHLKQRSAVSRLTVYVIFTGRKDHFPVAVHHLLVEVFRSRSLTLKLAGVQMRHVLACVDCHSSTLPYQRQLTRHRDGKRVLCEGVTGQRVQHVRVGKRAAVDNDVHGSLLLMYRDGFVHDRVHAIRKIATLVMRQRLVVVQSALHFLECAPIVQLQGVGVGFFLVAHWQSLT